MASGASNFLTINPSAARRLASESAAPYTKTLTERVAKHARLFAPGSMKDQIRAISTGGPSPLGIVVSDHPASIFVLRGTKAHVIKPRKPGGLLVFTPRGSSTKVFARVVNHPGTKANDFLTKALRSV
jgi:hypothetical protein